MDILNGKSFIDERHVLVIDQIPLLDEALDLCRRACLNLDRLRSGLDRYETRDLPAFTRWHETVFGAVLADLEEITSEVTEKETRLGEIKKRHWAEFFGTRAAIQAEVVEGFCSMHASWDDFDEDTLRSEEEYVFVEDELGAEEAGFTYRDGESEDFFDDLYARGDSRRKGEYRSRDWSEENRGYTRGAKPGAGPSCFEESSRARPAANARVFPTEDLASRLKERYRVLARQLHPDLNPGLGAGARSLWNQVQSAYRERNLDQLDLLLALSDAYRGERSGMTSLHQLRRATRVIEATLAPLRKRLEQARANRAWGFTELPDRVALQAEVARELARELVELRRRLEDVDAQIARFTRPRPAATAEMEERA